jgi:hypothetical protein
VEALEVSGGGWSDVVGFDRVGRFRILDRGSNDPAENVKMMEEQEEAEGLRCLDGMFQVLRR